jgi:thiol-disulfide isomerase/thioredoxin
MTHPRSRLLYGLLPGFMFCLLFCATRTLRADELKVHAIDTDINVVRYPARGDVLVIWQMNEAGPQAADKRLAAELAGHGRETWLLNVLEDYFLANTTNNMDRIPAQAFSRVLDAAARRNKKIVIASSGRGVIPVLRGVRDWQLANPGGRQLIGTILLSPKLFVETPDPGLSGTLMPIARATNQQLVLIQPEKSPWYWKLDQILAGLESGGSDVYLWPLPGIRDRFYFRPDASDREQRAGRELSRYIDTAVTLLSRQTAAARPAVREIQNAPAVPEGKKAHALSLYKGDPIPPPLQLPDLQGRNFDLAKLKGHVVLVNFWASWCPPCVHEMPSMQRLADALQDRPFSIIGVNMAEDRETIQTFLRRRVHVKFPIVLDRNGQALKAWHVFAFPTSYILDKQGHIRYALFGSIDWDSPEIKHTLEKLLAE